MVWFHGEEASASDEGLFASGKGAVIRDLLLPILSKCPGLTKLVCETVAELAKRGMCTSRFLSLTFCTFVPFEFVDYVNTFYSFRTFSVYENRFVVEKDNYVVWKFSWLRSQHFLTVAEIRPLKVL